VGGRVAAATIVLAIAAGSGTAATRQARPPLTIIGDSVAASLQYPNADRYLRRRFRLALDAKVCRRLVAASCPYNGVLAPSALKAIRESGPQPGSTVVIDVGYNDSASTYGRDLDRVMRALRADGVPSVVWLTLRHYGSVRRGWINALIREARDRWPELYVADWNAWSRGHRSWFIYDGMHLNRTGALGLARLIQRAVLASS